MASRIGSWSALTHGSDPTGSLTIGTGLSRMFVLTWQIERAAPIAVTITVGGQPPSHTFEYDLDAAVDEQIKIFLWNEAAITAMSGTAVSYSDDSTSSARLSWAYATYQNVMQTTPAQDATGNVSTTSLSLTTTSTANDMIVACVGDSAINRVPFDYDTLTEQLVYSASNVAHGIADGAGGDATTVLSNDTIAASEMVGMTVVLADSFSAVIKAAMYINQD